MAARTGNLMVKVNDSIVLGSDTAGGLEDQPLEYVEHVIADEEAVGN